MPTPRNDLETQRNALIEEQFRGIRDDLKELKERVAAVGNQVDSVRVADLSSVRAELAKQAADVQLLRYQVGRSSAIWGLVSGAVVSAIVGAVLSLVMHKPG